MKIDKGRKNLEEVRQGGRGNIRKKGQKRKRKTKRHENLEKEEVKERIKRERGNTEEGKIHRWGGRGGKEVRDKNKRGREEEERKKKRSEECGNVSKENGENGE